MYNDILNVSGKVEIIHFDENKNILNKIQIPNLVVNSGKDYIASRLGSNTPSFMNYIGIGGSSAAAAVGQTALVSEIASSRSLGNLSYTGSSITIVSTFGSGITADIQEAGVFNGPQSLSTAKMLSRCVFSKITKNSADIITISWTVTIS